MSASKDFWIQRTEEIVESYRADLVPVDTAISQLQKMGWDYDEAVTMLLESKL